MTAVDLELLIADVVRGWAGEAFPSSSFLADAASAAALRAFAGGASVSEACREGRRYVQSCQNHPSAAVGRSEREPLRVG